MVRRGEFYNYPGVADDEYEYGVEVEGFELTRLELTTPWGEAFDSADYLGAVWDGSYCEYEDAGFYFEAEGEAGLRSLEVDWEGLVGAEWTALDVGQTDLDVTYNGGSWAGSVDFDGVVVPAEVPQITYPAHGATDVPLSPTIRWNQWLSPPPEAVLRVGLDRTDTDEEVGEQFLSADATSWSPSVPLEPGVQYEPEVDFVNWSSIHVSGVNTDVVSYTGSEVLFTTAAVTPDVPGDTIADALVTGHDGSDKTLWYSYEIGDGLYGALDVDMYEVYVDDAGDLLVADIDADEIGSELDSILRVFDSSGVEVARNDDSGDWLDSYVSFVAPSAGTYYVGVSGYPNDLYDAWEAGSGGAGSVGTYDLTLEVRDRPPLDVPGDTIPDAMLTGHDGSDKTVWFSYEIGDGLFGDRDVDILSVTLDDAEDILIADVDAEEIGYGLDPVLEILDASGTQWAYDDDTHGFDSYLDWSPADVGLGAGNYYVVVRGFGNDGYDPFVAGSGSGGSTGNYELWLEVWDAGAPGADVPADTIPDALVTDHDGSDKVLSYSYNIGDGTYGIADVDVYAVYLDDAADVLIIDVDAQSIGSPLDSVVEVLDSFGYEWGYSDDSDGLDSYLEWSPADWELGPGTYYVVVRGAGNFDYDPWEGGWGSGGSTGYYDLVLEVRDGAAPGPDVPGDAIADAFITDHDGSSKVLSYRYTIGDGLHGALDVDVYAVLLDDAGDALVADVDARSLGSGLDSIIRVFDAAGTEMPLVSEWHGYDSSIEFEAPSAGTYYVGVSGVGNVDYDPNLAASGTASSTGFYGITLEVWDGGAPATDVPGDTMADALVTAHDGSDKTLQYSYAIGDNVHGANDVDMFRVDIPAIAGDSFRFSADIDAYDIGSGLDSVLRLFDGTGEELAYNDDAADPETALFSCDSQLSVLICPGVYYVGVSSFPNDLYDPGVADSGMGQTTGRYMLELSLAAVVAAPDAGDLISTATPLTLTANAWTQAPGHAVEPA